MKIEDVEIHPEYVWVKPLVERREIAGIPVGDGAKETARGVVMKIGDKAKDYFGTLKEGHIAAYEPNRGTPIDFFEEHYKVLHFHNVQAWGCE